MPGYYLLDHPPRRSQGAPRTTWGYPPKPSGVVAVHDTEGVMDDQGDDWGAENTANYIATRSDPGSYHEIHDGDSVVVMAPDDWMTWNVAADTANGHNWGISAACRTADWDPDAPWTRRVIRSMGRSIAAFWTRNGYDVATANRWITRDEANRRIPGLILHGTWQPADRSDAWATHPRRPELDRMLVDAIAEAAGLTDHQPTEEEELMAAIDDIRAEFVNQDTRTRAALEKQEADVKEWVTREAERTRDELVNLLVNKGVIKG